MFLNCLASLEFIFLLTQPP